MSVDVGRIPDIPVWDYVGLTVGTTSDTYTFKVGGSTGTTIYIVVIEYTDSGKSTIANVTKTFSQEHTLILQPGPSDGMDVTLKSSSPQYNYGQDTELEIVNNGPFGGSVRSVSLLKFDLSSIPSGSICDSAVLDLWGTTGVSGIGSNTWIPLYVFSILSANEEWSTTEGTPPWIGATWFKKYGSDDWAGSVGCMTSGVDFNATEIGTGVNTKWNGADPHVPDSINLTPAVVQTWFGSTNTNYGIRVYTTPEDQVGHDNLTGYVYSSDFTTAEKRPRLTVKWRNF